MLLVVFLSGCGAPSLSPLGPDSRDSSPASWTPIEDDETPPRWGHVAIADPLRDRVVVFGGSAPDGTPLADVWTFSLADARWSPLQTSEGPSPRFTAGAIADPERDRMVLFGGWNGDASGETWALSLEDGAWTRLPDGPPARFDVAAATDGTRAWFYGGFDGAGNALDDLWELDLATGAWRELPDGGVRPSPRTNVGFGFVAGVLLMTGGHDAGSLTGGSWRYDLSLEGWEEAMTSGEPAALAHYASATDDACAVLLLYGGDRNDEVDSPFLERLRIDGTFVPAVEEHLPPARRHAAIAVSAASRTAVLFGGWSGASEVLGDTWLLPLDECAPE